MSAWTAWTGVTDDPVLSDVIALAERAFKLTPDRTARASAVKESSRLIY
jgi:hypothetical protein